MNKVKRSLRVAAAASAALAALLIHGCKKDENPIKYQYGTFPDSVYNLQGMNSAYDDYNSNIMEYPIGTTFPIVFSSNRGSSGGQFDLVQGTVTYMFDQANGNFMVEGSMSNDIFYGTVISKANTAGNDMGPYSLFNNQDGYEYMFLASQAAGGNLDLFYLRHLPRYSTTAPVVSGPFPVSVINSTSEDAYISFDSNLDTAYFCSDRGGNFDIYQLKRPSAVPLDQWLVQAYNSASVVDSLKSEYDEKCPIVLKKVMVFASNRPGGMGGYDLYYSMFRKGKWSFPVNMGPDINTSSDEFRPLVGYNSEFTNNALIFSSNRPGGKGGFDLYFTGYTFPEK